MRTLTDRTDHLTEYLASTGHSPMHVWKQLLVRRVLGANDDGRFDDILEAPAFRGVDAAGIADLLAGVSIGEASVIYEFLLARGSMSEKRRHGQFFTPDDVARFMAEKARSFGAGVWLDPCCGIGNLSFWLVAEQSDPEAFLLASCRFLDLDQLALDSARCLFALAFQRREHQLFTRLEPQFVHGDFLRGAAEAVDHDFVLMNPPYLSGVAAPAGLRTAASNDLYAYFLERAFATSRGVVAITPQSFTNGRRHAALRRVLLDHAGGLDLYCFDNVPDTIFRTVKFGSENTNRVNSTRAAITVAHPSSGAGRPRITPLLRWSARERGRLFAAVDGLLGSPTTVDDTHLPKVARGLEPLYERLTMSTTRIADLLVDPSSTPHVLHVATTPRYFISAVERPLERASVQRLGFASEADLQRAKLVLNGSLAYFWWRVRDGGMTLARSTLWSTPVLDPVASPTAVASVLARLAESERSNVVVKRNAGRLNENVKHPLDLIAAVNRLLAPEHATALLTLHANSTLAGSDAPNLTAGVR